MDGCSPTCLYFVINFLFSRDKKKRDEDDSSDRTKDSKKSKEVLLFFSFLLK